MNGKWVTLRALQESDLEVLTKWNFDPVVTEFFSPRLPNSPAEQKQWLAAQMNGANKKKLMVLDAATQNPIGMLGIMAIDHVNKNAEIGLTIGEPSYWGKPHGKEALHLGLRFLFEEFNFHMVYLTIFERNVRGIRFFEKLGFRHDGLKRDCIFAHGTYHSLLFMSLLKSEYNSINYSTLWE
jgi:RimJ/RimL family protein N-acetyltransferase